MKLHELTIHEAHDRLREGDITSVELTEVFLDRIANVDDAVKAYLTLTPEVALKKAREADRRISRAKGDFNHLLGVPMAIKDVICTEGIRTTCASKILEDFVPPYDATAVRRVSDAGAVLLGKLNMDEFAMGSSTENSHFFTTHNPWDLDRVPGGSSGGSAAAVAADETVFALGSDTGGSIRQPASLCGIVGLKPTYGRVSRYGLVAHASSLDQIGPMTKDVRDCALVMNAIAGPDPCDSTSVDVSTPDYTQALTGDIQGLRVGVAQEYFGEGMEPDVETTVRNAVDVLADLGADVDKVSMPHTEYALPTYYLIAPSETMANLARYDGVKFGYAHPETEDIWDFFRSTRAEGFGTEVKRRIMLGTYALSAGYYEAYYLRAQKVRTLIKQDFDEAFETFDILIAPTAPTVAFPIGERIDDPMQMYLSDVLTVSLNLVGLCGIAIPCGYVSGLPVGMQIFGQAFDESTLLRVAHAYEQATDWHNRKPEL